jgi:hypothetical protein
MQEWVGVGAREGCVGWGGKGRQGEGEQERDCLHNYVAPDKISSILTPTNTLHAIICADLTGLERQLDGWGKIGKEEERMGGEEV